MKSKKTWYILGIGSLIFIILLLISNVISVGEKLSKIHVYVEYGFYVISVFLFYILILNPIRIIVFAPTFSIDHLMDDDVNKQMLYKQAAKNLMKTSYLSDEDRLLLKAGLKNRSILKENLKTVFANSVKIEMNKEIFKNAKTALVTTAISQNGSLDMVSIIVINLKLIKNLVQICGFRPSYAHLGKLSINVLAMALIAEGLEDVDINEFLPSKLTQGITELPVIKTLANSAMQGISNGLLTARVGIVTRKYLFADNKEVTKKQIRKSSFKEALSMMPKLVFECAPSLPKGIVKMFGGKNKKQEA